MKMQLFVCKICYDSFGSKGALTLAVHTKYNHKRKPVQSNTPFLKWLWNLPSKAEKESCDGDIHQMIAFLYHPIKVPRHAVQPSDARQKKKKIPRIPKVVPASPAKKRKPKAKKSKPKVKKPKTKPTKKKKPKPPQVKSRETLSFLSPPPLPLADFPRERRKRPIGPSSIPSKKQET